MNSIKYIEHVIDLFDLEMFKEKQIRKFDITYLAEGMFAAGLHFYKQSADNREFIVDKKKGNDSVCRSRILWEDIRIHTNNITSN